MASNCAECVVFWCEWLQFTLIGLLTTECVTLMACHELSLTTTYISPVLSFDAWLEWDKNTEYQQ